MLARSSAGAPSPAPKHRGRPRKIPISSKGQNPNTDPTPKKRGRPRKSVSIPTPPAAAANLSASTTDKRQRGRPPKVPQSPDSGSTALDAKTDRPKKVVQPGLNPMPVAVNSSVGMKKRGRPGTGNISTPLPSAMAVDSSPSHSHPLQQSPCKVAREVETVVNPMPSDANTWAEKRKPGRPRKAAVLSSSVVLALDDKAGEGVELSPEQIPQVEATSVGKCMPLLPKKLSLPSSPILAAIETMKLGRNPMRAVVTTSVEKKMPEKVSPSSSPVLIGDANATLLNPVRPSPGKKTGEEQPVLSQCRQL